MVDYNTGGIRCWENSNVEAEIIHHFPLLAQASRKLTANFIFPSDISVFQISTSLAPFYYLVYFFLMLNIITPKMLYFSFSNMFYHFIYSSHPRIMQTGTGIQAFLLKSYANLGRFIPNLFILLPIH